MILTNEGLAGTNDIKFVTQGTEPSSQVRMLIDAGGKVGIGTTTPAAKLDIFGGDVNSTNLILSANYKDAYRWRFNTLDRGDGIDLDFTSSDYSDIQEPVLKLSRSNSGRPEFQLYNNAIVANDGNVGIGTTTPSVRLDVEGDIKFNGTISTPARMHITGNEKLYLLNKEGVIIGREWGGNGSLWVQGETRLQGNATFDSYVKITGNNALNFSTYGGGFFMQDNDWIRTWGDKNFYHNTGIMRTDGTFQVGGDGTRFLVNTNGNVGIGTTKPDQRLTVNGTVHASEIIVDTKITPDYVFQKYYTGKSELKSDYVMPTLFEIEQFAKANHHLPNVPSAQEIKANGLELGKMNNLLLQKIEELTLYAIEQQKQLEAQHNDIEALKALVKMQAAKK